MARMRRDAETGVGKVLSAGLVEWREGRYAVDTTGLADGALVPVSVEGRRMTIEGGSSSGGGGTPHDHDEYLLPVEVKGGDGITVADNGDGTITISSDDSRTVIANGGFEAWNGALPTSWGVFWKSGTGTFRKETTDVQRGAAALRWSPVAIGNFQRFTSTEFAVQPLQQVTITAWARQIGTGLGQVALALLTNTAANKPDYFEPGVVGQEDTFDLDVNAGWTRLEATFTVPAGHTRASVPLSVLAPGPGLVTGILLDSVEVVVEDTPIPTTQRGWYGSVSVTIPAGQSAATQPVVFPTARFARVPAVICQPNATSQGNAYPAGITKDGCNVTLYRYAGGSTASALTVTIWLVAGHE